MTELARLKKKWMQAAPGQWWGDSVDVRFYLIRQLKRLRHRTVLDVGCNIGLILDELHPSNSKHGFDMNWEVLHTSRKIHRQAPCVARASFFDGFPYRDNSFDAVIMANVMPYHEIEHPELEPDEQKRRVLSEVHRVLKPGGTLFLTTPNGAHLCYRQTNRIHLAALRQVLRDFELVTIQGWNPLPSAVFFLPPAIKIRIPRKYHKYLFLPSPALAKIPGILEFFGMFLNAQKLLPYARAFYVECKKGGSS